MMLRVIRQGMMLWLLTSIILTGVAAQSCAATKEPVAKRIPLRVVIRPRIRQKEEEKPLIDSEILRQIQENGLEFRWENILNSRFYSGNEDAESLKKFGYPINSEIGSSLQKKIRLTDDPDNMLHLNEYSDRQLYSGAPLVIIDLMQEIQQGCKIKIPGKCGVTEYGQYWLKFNMNIVDISRARSDNALAVYVKSRE